MKTIEQKRMELLQETADHYNIDNRCYMDGFCRYTPIQDKSEGCAIGRKISRELAERFDDIRGPKHISTYEVFQKLPKELRELGSEFLQALQNLHDITSNWNESGLSVGGSEEFERIKNMYCID